MTRSQPNFPPQNDAYRRDTLFFALINDGEWITRDSVYSNGFEIQGYADDIAILVRGKLQTQFPRLQTALSIVVSACK